VRLGPGNAGAFGCFGFIGRRARWLGGLGGQEQDCQGPVAMATPALAPHKPMARARSLLWVKTLEISDSVAGNVMAAPSPITDRAAMSCAGSVVKPPARLAVPPLTPPRSVTRTL
jgi:hypothetical protein